MSRILKELEKYEETVTVGQLIEKIKKEQELEKQVEVDEEIQVLFEFENTYLKVLEEDCLFGKELNIIELKNFIRKERTEDWEFVYYFEGSKMSVSNKSLFHNSFNPERCSNSFSLEDLEGMTKITEEEYLKYKWEFENIKKQLEKLAR